MRTMFPILFRLIRFAVFAGIAGFFVLGGYALWVARDLPTPEAFAERRVTESTKIYDRSGTVLLYEIHGEERRTVIPDDQIPENAKQAIIVAEDERFFYHFGFDPKAIMRSVYANITKRKIVQGGSTITQQLIRNTIITRERTFARKIKELILAVELEARYSKDELLGFYLNSVPFGENAYGIEAASQTYFGKPAKSLSLNEAVTLSALPRKPSYFSPYGSHTDELLSRKDRILTRMVEQGYVSKETYETAHGILPAFVTPSMGIKAPHFVMYVREYLEARFGKEALEHRGFNVITTLDWELQELADRVVKQGGAKNEKAWRAENAALVAIDPKTGQILAMVGSRDYFDTEHDGNVNVAIRPRQPGSSFKPFAYATAFEKGYTPNTIVFDLVTEFSAGGAQGYRPQNYDGVTHGPVSLRQALANSLNIPAVKVLYLAGIDSTIDRAQSMGITTLNDRERYGLALVLGGGEVLLVDMASSFGVFAQDGVGVSKTPILKISDHTGEVIEEFQPLPTRTIDKNVARMVNDILSDNEARSMVFGPNSPLVVPDFSVAAKTGTTEDFRDGWTVGYSPSLVAGVWVGNNDNRSMRQGADGVRVAAPLWNAFMKEALPRFKKEGFVKPEIPLTGKPMLDGSFVVEQKIKIDTISEKLATEYTPEELIEERVVSQVHEILFWVQKEKPLDAEPQRPDADPQYENWERPVRQWLAAHPEIVLSSGVTIPSEFDDVHKEEYRPRVTILSPEDGNILAPDKPIDLVISAESHFPQKEAIVFIDDTVIKTIGLAETTLQTVRVQVSLPAHYKASLGNRVLSVRVVDIYKNVGFGTHTISFLMNE